MGKVRARTESGNLFFEFRFNGVRCREQTRLPDTPANRKKMQLVLQKIEAEITLGQFDYAACFPKSKMAKKFSEPVKGAAQQIASADDDDRAYPAFRSFALQWLGENEVRWRKSTAELQQSILNKHLLPKFGGVPVNKISKADVLGFRADLAKTQSHFGTNLSAKTINEVVGTLKAIMDEAADRFEFTSPTERLKRLKVQKKDIAPFTLEEVKLILANVRRDYESYMNVRFFTGMRSGELHGLKWKYVDFERRQILIRETFTKGRVEYTKNDGSQREIHMSEPVYQALLTQRAATEALSEYVFCNRLGAPLDNKNFTNRVWYPMLKHLNLELRRPYHTRHTAATLWLAAGESPEWIARQMGHTSTMMLFRVYSRYVPNMTRQDGSAFDRLLNQEIGKKPS